MPVMYRIHQDQSTGTKRSGKFYARAVPVGVMEYDEFCKEASQWQSRDPVLYLHEPPNQ